VIFSERNENIYKLKKSGLTYNQIAEMYSICSQRVIQIYFKVREYKENYDSYPPLKKILPTLTQRALTFYFNDEHILEHPEKIIIGTKFSDLRRKAPCIGKIGANRISQALIDLGYLKPDDNWLKD
jgi:hypothetical protein